MSNLLYNVPAHNIRQGFRDIRRHISNIYDRSVILYFEIATFYNNDNNFTVILPDLYF